MTTSAFSIFLHNHSGVTLTRYLCETTSGGVPVPYNYQTPTSGQWQSVSVVDGSQVIISATGSTTCVGKIALEDANQTVKFQIDYNIPNSSSPATIVVSPDSDYPACVGMNDQASLTGPAPTVTTRLYVGCEVTEWDSNDNAYTAGYTVPVASNPYQDNNAADVVNSMFQPSIRTSDAVQHRYNQGTATPYRPADYSGGQLAGSTAELVDAMQNLWPTIGASTSGPDYPIIEFLADFVVPTDTSQAPLVMYVPQLKYKSYDGSGDTQGPVYELEGYQAYPLAGTGGARFNSSSVQTFLQLLLAGAHFVNIQASRDFQNLNKDKNATNTGRDLYNTFKNSFPDIDDDDSHPTTSRHACTGNSHYAFGGPIVNMSGWYYGGQYGEWASAGCGLLLSLLFAQTADGQYNTFMQLEGWPADTDWWNTGASIKGGDRHAADFDAYKASLWNISTFGASPYSEKRATTIFLAPAPWVPQIYSGTYMMPYVGAETPQSWLKTSLVKVPSGTDPTPDQYS